MSCGGARAAFGRHRKAVDNRRTVLDVSDAFSISDMATAARRDKTRFEHTPG